MGTGYQFFKKSKYTVDMLSQNLHDKTQDVGKQIWLASFPLENFSGRGGDEFVRPSLAEKNGENFVAYNRLQLLRERRLKGRKCNYVYLPKIDL